MALMNIELYNTTDMSRKVVNKTLTLISTVSGDLKKDSSVLDPVVEIKYTYDSVIPNYVYIPLFRRFYFITDLIVKPGNVSEITLHVDVLHTYRNAIMTGEAVVTKTSLSEPTLASLSGSGERVIQNPGFPAGAKTEINRVAFGSNEVTNNQSPNWILTVLG